MSSKVNLMNVVDGISVIDSEYYSKDFAAIYLLKQKNKVIIIETGTNYTMFIVSFKQNVYLSMTVIRAHLNVPLIKLMF